MKKLISLLLVIFMCFSAIMTFVACDTEEANEGNTTNKVETPTEAPTKVPENEETTAKEAVSEENTTEEATTEEATSEETTTEEATTESVRKLTQEEWYALANPELYMNHTIRTTQIDRFFKTVAITKLVDEHVYIEYTTFNHNSGESGYDRGDASLSHIDKTTIIPDLKDYTKIEYDATRGVYYYIEPFEIVDISNPEYPMTITYTKYEWTIKDGRIHMIYNEFWYMDNSFGKIEASQTVEYYDYGTTIAPWEPKHPENPGGSPAIEMTEEIWLEAFALDVDYLQVSMRLYENGNEIYFAASNRAQDIIQIVDSDFSRMAIDYMVKVDGGWYFYNDETESPDFNADRVYYKWLKTPADCHGDDEFEQTKNSPRDMISVFANKFDAFSYSDDKGGYYASSIENYTNVVIIFENNKIVQISYGDEEQKIVFEFAYDEFSIFLPDATEVDR